MTKPSRFIMNSDYATFKNDAGTTLSITLPNGYSLLAGEKATIEEQLVIGKRDASIRSKIRCNSGTWRNCSALQKQFNMTLSGIGSYTSWLTASVERISPTTIRLFAIIDNTGNPATMTVNGDYVFKASIRTFISPWS